MLNRIDDREMLDSQRTMNPRWRHAYIKTKTPSERETEKESERIERETRNNNNNTNDIRKGQTEERTKGERGRQGGHDSLRIFSSMKTIN